MPNLRHLDEYPKNIYFFNLLINWRIILNRIWTFFFFNQINYENNKKMNFLINQDQILIDWKRHFFSSIS